MPFNKNKKQFIKNDEDQNTQTYHNKLGFDCSIICIIIALALLIIIGFGFMYKQIDTINYKPFNCIIENVSYSTLTLNLSNPNDIAIAHNFVDCNCGHKCISKYGTCVNLWGRNANDPSDTIRILQKSTTNAKTECTFQEKNCKDSKNIIDRINAANTAQEHALSYLNTNQTCYTKNNKTYYLSNSINMDLLITCSVLFGLILLCCCAFICHYLCFLYKQHQTSKHKNTKNKVHIVQIENESFSV